MIKAPLLSVPRPFLALALTFFGPLPSSRAFAGDLADPRNTIVGSLATSYVRCVEPYEVSVNGNTIKIESRSGVDVEQIVRTDSNKIFATTTAENGSKEEIYEVEKNKLTQT